MRGLGGVSYVDVDDMATSLQSTYSDYSRKKKQRFRTWVGKMYLSLHQSNQLGNLLNLSKEEDREEDWLERREKDHFKMRMKEIEKEHQNGIEMYD